MTTRLGCFFALCWLITTHHAAYAQANVVDDRLGLMRADSEVFAGVVRPRPLSADDSLVYGDPELEIDARPWGEPKGFAEVAGGGIGLASRDLFFLPDSALMPQLTDVRRRILAAQGRREGSKFSFPRCGGTLSISPPSASAGAPASRPGCPSSNKRYLSVGVPYHGVPESLKKNRVPIDSSGDVWTVVVNEHYAGPGGQNWFQNALLLKRDASTGNLRVVRRILLSWAE